VKTEERLDECGVALHSVTEYIDTTTPVGRFNFRNLASAAELETDLTSKRVKMGMFGLAQDHVWPNDHPPLGYNRLEDGTLEVDDSEAELVERIFRMYLRLESMPDVAYRLNESGIRSKTGAEWSTQSVRKVLKNELYTGKYDVAGFEDYVDDYRIITDELFDEVKETRFRFQRDPMDKDRKEAIADEIYEQFKDYSEG
jgi:site-specific DNA recombinase